MLLSPKAPLLLTCIKSAWDILFKYISLTQPAAVQSSVRCLCGTYQGPVDEEEGEERVRGLHHSADGSELHGLIGKIQSMWSRDTLMSVRLEVRT